MSIYGKEMQKNKSLQSDHLGTWAKNSSAFVVDPSNVASSVVFFGWHLSGPKSSTTISIPPTGSKWIAIDDKVSTLSLLLGLAGSQLDVILIA